MLRSSKADRTGCGSRIIHVLVVASSALAFTGALTSCGYAPDSAGPTFPAVSVTTPTVPVTNDSGSSTVDGLPSLAVEDLAYVRFGIREFHAISPVGQAGETNALVAAYQTAVFGTDAGTMSFNGDLLVEFVLRDGSKIQVKLGNQNEAGALVQVLTGGSNEEQPFSGAILAPELDRVAREFLESTVDAGGGELPASMPANFGFIASYGMGSGNVLDTYAGTFTKDLIKGTPPTATTALRLDLASTAILYEGLVSMDILDYPSDFQPATTGTTMSSSSSYHLLMSGQGFSKEIHWEDSHLSSDPKAVALRNWFQELERLVQSTPEYQSLPAASGGYY